MFGATKIDKMDIHMILYKKFLSLSVSHENMGYNGKKSIFFKNPNIYVKMCGIDTLVQKHFLSLGNIG